MAKQKTPTSVMEALQQVVDALETCREMADANNDGISYGAADNALTALAPFLPLEDFVTEKRSPNWKAVIDNVLSYHQQGFYDDKTALAKLRRSVDDLREDDTP